MVEKPRDGPHLQPTGVCGSVHTFVWVVACACNRGVPDRTPCSIAAVVNLIQLHRLTALNGAGLADADRFASASVADSGSGHGCAHQAGAVGSPHESTAGQT